MSKLEKETRFRYEVARSQVDWLRDCWVAERDYIPLIERLEDELLWVEVKFGYFDSLVEKSTTRLYLLEQIKKRLDYVEYYMKLFRAKGLPV